MRKKELTYSKTKKSINKQKNKKKSSNSAKKVNKIVNLVNKLKHKNPEHPKLQIKTIKHLKIFKAE